MATVHNNLNWQWLLTGFLWVMIGAQKSITDEDDSRYEAIEYLDNNIVIF